jgi:glycosyltransferase involved in cell wall biosynthesis
MRYVWHQYTEHTTRLGYGSLPIKVLLAYLRKWDRRAAQRANHMVTNSQWTAAKIREAFGREATVIHPPVHVERFHPVQSKGDYFLTVCRLVPYKRVDLIVKAFNRLKLPLVVVGDGSEFSKLYKLAQPNVTLLPYQVQEDLNKLMANAKAFVYAAEEDFGIAAVEAQAAGCPVIAFGRGGLTETVVEGVSGIFYDEQSVDAIVTAIEVFQKREKDFQTAAITKNAERFSAERFVNSFSEFMNEKIAGRAA